MSRALGYVMLRTLLAYILLAGVCATAVGIANADDAPAPEMSKRDTATWLAFFDKLVTTVVKASSAPCKEMADDVNRVIAANRHAIDIARDAHAHGKKLPQSAQEHMFAGVKKMMPAMQRCGEDGKVRAAFAKLDLTREHAAARRSR